MLVFLASCSSNNALNDLNPTPAISALSPSFATANGLSSSGLLVRSDDHCLYHRHRLHRHFAGAWNGSNRTTALNVETNQLSVTCWHAT